MSSYTAGLHKLCVLWMCLPGFSQVSEGYCLDGFTSHDGQCYLYIQNQYNWFEAQVACWTMGARLVEIDSKEKNHFITNFLRGRGGKSAWIGVTDMAEETEWAESSLYKEGFDLCSLWGKTEPNNHGGKEDCVYIEGWHWFDHGCHSGQHSVVCEML